jgi:predicted nucleic acid-binding protein
VLTIDASVWVASDPAVGEAHADAIAFLGAAIRGGEPLHQPAITLVEVASALARRTGDADLARRGAALIAQLPGLVVHPLDAGGAARAAALAATTKLRAADAVYASVALENGATLVTLDDELSDRCPAGLDVLSPREWLAREDPHPGGDSGRA